MCSARLFSFSLSLSFTLHFASCSLQYNKQEQHFWRFLSDSLSLFRDFDEAKIIIPFSLCLNFQLTTSQNAQFSDVNDYYVTSYDKRKLVPLRSASSLSRIHYLNKNKFCEITNSAVGSIFSHDDFALRKVFYKSFLGNILYTGNQLFDLHTI